MEAGRELWPVVWCLPRWLRLVVLVRVVCGLNEESERGQGLAVKQPGR